MIPVLNGIGVKCAVFGNHDFGKLTCAVSVIIYYIRSVLLSFCRNYLTNIYTRSQYVSG